MSSDAPAVVALVVAAGGGAGGATGRGPNERLEEALEALAAQDYPNYSVLVAGPAELAPRVASCLPDAHFAQLPEGAGFAEGANVGVEAVEGAAHVLVCHDDVALAPDALRLLVEEAYRSNAGLTCPKLVSWDEPSYLLSVGMAADYWGGVHPLVEPGELDQGQHDAVREVFVASTAAVLVRADLWRALGGMSGGDLDLCWRAHLAGARVVVAPQAVAKHLSSCGPQAAYTAEVERLRVLWTCYGPWALVLVAPAAVAFSVFGALWALMRPPHRHAGRPLMALVESLRRPRQLLAARRRAQALRRTSDRAMWKVQDNPGSFLWAALSERVARAAALAGEHLEGRPVAVPPPPNGLGSPSSSGAGETEGSYWALPLGRKWLALAAACVVVLLVAGSRDLVGAPLPLVGQLLPARGGVGAWWGDWWSGPGAGGLGGVPFGPPALLVMGILGYACFGSAGAAAHLALLAPLVLGPLGAYFGARKFVALPQPASERGPLAAGVLYAALPVAYNAIANGHLAGLVSYAAAPWLLAGVAGVPQAGPGLRLGGLGLPAGGRPVRRFVALALVAAVAGAFAPPALLLAPVMGAALAAGSVLVGRGRGAHRYLLSGVAVGALAFVMLLPWSIGTSLAGTGAARPGLSAVLRLVSGPYGRSWAGWAFLAAAAVAVLIGRGERLAWAGRMWAVTMVFLALGWSWSPFGGTEELLAPAGAALAYSVALGAASVELDLRRYRFGWRQFAPAFGVAAALVACLPLLTWAAGGRWGLGASGAEAAYSFPPAGPGGSYRVLWVAASGELPLAAEGTVGGRLDFGASADGLPNAAQLWPAPPSPLAKWVRLDLSWAEAGETSDLGHLLGLAAVRYVAVPVTPSDEGLIGVLARQVDLYPVGIDPSYAVYENSAWVPMLGRAPASTVAAALAKDLWRAASLAVRPGPAAVALASSKARAHAFYGAVPPGTWGVRVAGRPLKALRGAVGASVWFAPSTARAVELGKSGEHAGAAVTLALWAAALAAAALSKDKRRGAELAKVPAVAERSELVLAGRGP